MDNKRENAKKIRRKKLQQITRNHNFQSDTKHQMWNKSVERRELGQHGIPAILLVN